VTRTQQVIWTVLPNGMTPDGKQLRLSVLVSPRLITDALPGEPLKAFPDFLDWADRVAHAKFVVKFAGAAADAVFEVRPDPAIHARLFDTATFVQSHAFEDKRNTTVLTSPIVALERDLSALYGDISAAAYDELPSRLDWHRVIGELGKAGRADLESVLRVLRAERRKHGDQAGQGIDATQQGRMAIHDAYNTPLSVQTLEQHPKTGPAEVTWPSNALVALPDPASFAQTIDFHRIVGLLSQHPEILRAAGFRLDLLVKRNQLPQAATDRLELDVHWPQSGKVTTLADGLPATQTRLDKDTFAPAPHSAAEALAIDGFARIGQRTGALHVDVNGSMLKLRQFAINIAHTDRHELERSARSNHEDDPVDAEPNRAGAPALRTGGLTFADDVRGHALEAAFDRAADLQSRLASNSAITLFQEDLLRGLRAEVSTDGGPWQSLCRRNSSYTFVTDHSNQDIADTEGTIRVAASGAADGSLPDVLKVDAGIFSWSGWSLVAPRPGRFIDPSDQVGDPESLAPPGLPLEVTHKPVAKSLPSLRFGHSYRIRLRIVDLAGNARTYDSKAAAPKGTETEPAVYRRFEPIEAPSIALVGRVTTPPPTDGESLAVLAIRSFNVTDADNTVPTAQQAERHVVPPAGSQKMAELHGMLDNGGRLDPSTYARLVAQDSELAVTDGASSEAKFPVAEAVFKLPFLPDPLSRSCVARIAGFGDGSRLEVRVPLYDVGAKWPDASAFRVQLFEGPNAAKFDEGERILRVSMAKGEHVRLRITHELRDDDLPLLGVLQWGLGRSKPDVQTTLRRRALEGRDWMLTPWRDLDLVHAVQKPLVRPKVERLEIHRALGATRVTMSLTTTVDTLSSEKLDLMGHWLDPRDDPAKPGPEWIVGGAHATELKLRRLSAPGFIPPGRLSFPESDVAQVFADTHYRRVGYGLTATTRFTQFMPDALRDPAVSADLTVVSDETIRFVPNAAPPPAPDIVYVIPTFGWARKTDKAQQRSYRDGGGLRVYMRRPWLVTGAMEMLAVVLPPATASDADIDQRLDKTVTRWGSDPTVSAAGLAHGAPNQVQFAFAVTQGPIDPAMLDPVFPVAEGQLPTDKFQINNLILPGAPAGTRVDVAPHLVGYDPERQLWFADIVIDPGKAYMPFIRLALARYQPISVPGAHLSSVATTEVVQLTNDRMATVTRSSPLQYRISLFGEALGTLRSATAPSRVEIAVENLQPGDNEDFGWLPLKDVIVREPQIVAPRPTRGRAPVQVTAPSLVPTPIAESAIHSLQFKRDFTSLIARGDITAVLAMPTITDKELVLPRAPAAGERFRLIIAERELRTPSASEAIGENDDHSARIVYLEIFTLDV